MQARSVDHDIILCIKNRWKIQDTRDIAVLNEDEVITDDAY